MNCRPSNDCHILESLGRLKQSKIVYFIFGNDPQCDGAFAAKISVYVAYAFGNNMVVCYNVSAGADHKSGAIYVD